MGGGGEYHSVLDVGEEIERTPMSRAEIEEKLDGHIPMTWDEMFTNESNLLGKWIRYINESGEYKAGGFLTCVRGEMEDISTQYVGLVRISGGLKVSWCAQAAGGTVYWVKYSDLIKINTRVDEKSMIDDDDDIYEAWKRHRGIDFRRILRTIYPASERVKSEYIVVDSNVGGEIQNTIRRFVTATGVATAINARNERQIYHACKSKTPINGFYISKRAIGEVGNVIDQVERILGGL